MGVVKNGCSHSGYRAFKLATSHKGINGINWLFKWWYKFRIANNYWVGMVKSGCAHFVAPLAVSQNWMDELSWFFVCWCKFRKNKNYFNNFWVFVVKNGHETLISEWMDEFSWLFACSWILRKAKSYFNSYWVGIVKYGCGLVGHGILKSSFSQEKINKLSWFFACWNWCNNFWLDD